MFDNKFFPGCLYGIQNTVTSACELIHTLTTKVL
jgi:hypothetical protein